MEKWREELYHHGILGMKWGVRRYQNYDGSYTQKGLARYRKTEEKYREAQAKKKNATSNYKAGTGSKSDVKSAKQDVKKAKKEMSKAYDHLKMDKRADEGKKLYQKGKTITDNQMNYRQLEVGLAAASLLTHNVLKNSGKTFTTKYGNIPISSLAPKAVALGGNAVLTAMRIKNASDNRKLRAYYGHTGYKG